MDAREEFELIVKILAEGKGNKALRNRLYDLAAKMKRDELLVAV